MDSDEDLLARSVRAPEAFEALVVRHSVVLHGYLARRTPTSADDLLSEVWLQAFAGRSSFDARRGTARGWLFGVAHHVLAAHWRRVERLTSTDASTVAGPAEASDPWHAVDQRLDAAAMAPRLRQGLSELPDVERELLLLMAWERLTPTEAAEVLGIPPGTARSRLHRTRKKLQALLDRPMPLAGVGTTGGTTATGELS